MSMVMQTEHFADRLKAAVARKGNAVVVGLDPRLESLPDDLLATCRATYGDTTRAAGEALWQFNRGIIDVVHDLVPVVKPQIAFYERYGLHGLQAYVQTVQYARAAGLLVIADAKRNDIGPTAVAYAEAFLGTTQVFGHTVPGNFEADALTVNAFLGRDGIQPFLEQAQQYGRGLFVLVKTSNASSGDLQDVSVHGQPLYAHLGQLVETWGAASRGRCGYSLLGAVVGATYPEQARTLRALMPHTLFLVPGYGAQGATAADVAGCFDAQGFGAIVNASRSILFAFRTPAYATMTYGAAARAATQQMIQELQHALAHAPQDHHKNTV
jgi:orotidine-5'-phosphate decarboxylase